MGSWLEPIWRLLAVGLCLLRKFFEWELWVCVFMSTVMLGRKVIFIDTCTVCYFRSLESQKHLLYLLNCGSNWDICYHVEYRVAKIES